MQPFPIKLQNKKDNSVHFLPLTKLPLLCPAVSAHPPWLVCGPQA